MLSTVDAKGGPVEDAEDSLGPLPSLQNHLLLEDQNYSL